MTIDNNTTQAQELEARDVNKDLDDVKSLLNETRKLQAELRQQQEEQNRIKPLIGQGSFTPQIKEEVVETQFDPNDLSYKDQFELYSDELRHRRSEYQRRLTRGTEEERRLGVADNLIRAEENIFIRGLQKFPKVMELKGMKSYLDSLIKGKYSDVATQYVQNQLNRFDHCKELGVLEQVKKMRSDTYLSMTPIAFDTY